MKDDINRREITHVDAKTGTARCTAQWLLEKRNLKGSATHPITHNNKLTMFICGKDGFADIANEIGKARHSIDICCWGFDPGMELVRPRGGTWPRGETYGDLLIDAGKRGVRVRLLVWFDWAAAKAGKARNLPGMTHDLWVWRVDGGLHPHVHKLSAANSLEALRREAAQRRDPDSRYLNSLPLRYKVNEGTIPLLARQEYCASWFQAVRSGLLRNVELRTHRGDCDSIERELSGESTKLRFWEGALMEHFGTHHQKPLLIDFAFDEGSKAVGYVMGLNSVTDYWDTPAHPLEDHRREQVDPAYAANAAPAERGFKSLKPYRDYACRIDRGAALVALNNNFIALWDRAHAACRLSARPASPAAGTGLVPATLSRKPEPDDSTVQIVRTQATDGDQTIRELYFKAADNAGLAFRYLYMENQYFQYEEWTKRLLESRRRVVRLWNEAKADAGKRLSDMPILHVFIVIPMPELEEMIPRTYDALATLGQHAAMAGQQKLIDAENKRKELNGKARAHPLSGSIGAPQTPYIAPEVVRHANSIDKPSIKRLEEEFGIKVCTAMLNACDYDGKRWRTREIYIHSKLLLVDDVFCTLGSANMNQRSMVVDSELNLATTDSRVTMDLRRRVWGQLSGGKFDGGGGSKSELATVFDDWCDRMEKNMNAKAKGEKMIGFLLPLLDQRSSLSRLG